MMSGEVIFIDLFGIVFIGVRSLIWWMNYFKGILFIIVFVSLCFCLDDRGLGLINVLKR